MPNDRILDRWVERMVLLFLCDLKQVGSIATFNAFQLFDRFVGEIEVKDLNISFNPLGVNTLRHYNQSSIGLSIKIRVSLLVIELRIGIPETRVEFVRRFSPNFQSIGGYWIFQ